MGLHPRKPSTQRGGTSPASGLYCKATEYSGQLRHQPTSDQPMYRGRVTIEGQGNQDMVELGGCGDRGGGPEGKNDCCSCLVDHMANCGAMTTYNKRRHLNFNFLGAATD